MRCRTWRGWSRCSASDEVHCARDAITAELDANELGRLAEDGALVHGGVQLDEQLVEDRAGALRVADKEVVDVERDVEGDATGVDQFPEVGLNFAGLEANLGECGRVALHLEVARLLGPLERAEKLARHFSP